MRSFSANSFSQIDSDRHYVGIDVEPEATGESLPRGSSRRKYRRASSLTSRMRRMVISNHALFKSKQAFVFIISITCAIFFIVGFLQPTSWKSGPLLDASRAFLRLPKHPNFSFSSLDDLIMVAGHSVYVSSKCSSASSNEAWFLEPYQKLSGQAHTFLDHIRVGVLKASEDPSSLLLFSGGETRKSAGPRTEAQSYWVVAESAEWFGKPEVRDRALTEESARDSFENLLFSICRFRELTGKYPRNITVVSYDFKEKRFQNAHRAALRFPPDRFRYVGTAMVDEGRKAAEAAEANTLKDFEADPYGCLGELSRKRLNRDPFYRSIPYPTGCPEIAKLFSYCGKSLYDGDLPW